mmetsp:Transcript_41659/g.75372  ORF Transcript_41659/g.75372 Transcript_41659/m.75372 type:complete len:230 (-) Transcript_41659:73-762(-)
MVAGAKGRAGSSSAKQRRESSVNPQEATQNENDNPFKIKGGTRSDPGLTDILAARPSTIGCLTELGKAVKESESPKDEEPWSRKQVRFNSTVLGTARKDSTSLGTAVKAKLEGLRSASFDELTPILVKTPFGPSLTRREDGAKKTSIRRNGRRAGFAASLEEDSLQSTASRKKAMSSMGSLEDDQLSAPRPQRQLSRGDRLSLQRRGTGALPSTSEQEGKVIGCCSLFS